MIDAEDLFAEYEQNLRRFACRLTGDADEANDLVAETFLRAYLHLPLLRQLNPAQRKAWLYRVVKNRFIDEKRAAQRERAFAKQMAWADSLASPPVYSLDAVSQIPEKYRRVLEMHYSDQMTSEEIGKKLGVPAATIRSRLRLALQWLRAHPSNYK